MEGMQGTVTLWGLAVVALSIIATIAVIVVAVVWSIRPGETDPNHIKRRILRDE